MRVKDAMHDGVETATSSMPVTEVAGIMMRHDIGALPVVDETGLIGMVTDRDIACKALVEGKPPPQIFAKDVMTTTPIYCRDTEEVSDAVHLMENNRIRRLPVLDADDNLVGMLSLGDVAHAMSLDLTGELTKAVSGHHDSVPTPGSSDPADA